MSNDILGDATPIAVIGTAYAVYTHASVPGNPIASGLGTCLDNQMALRRNSNRVASWHCDGGDSQVFEIVKVL